MGWVHRAMNDWDASAAAWLRCADELQGSPQARAALWHAAENFEWTGQPQAAADVLRRMLRDCPAAGDREATQLRIEELDAQAKRDAQWLGNPVASLVAEIEDRAPHRDARAVFQSVSTWLEARGLHAQLAEVSRWATAQPGWPRAAQVNAHAQLARALLRQDGSGRREKTEAAAALDRLMELATCDSVLTAAGIRRAVLLRELGDPWAAQATLRHIADEAGVSAVRDARFLAERIRVHAACGDTPRAASDLDRLIEIDPEHPERGALRRLVEEGH
jgi:hypothetical protein